ncbi:MAG: hypothetical protein E7655_00335 [Ruminococcaceae bacterium]|nr:hypothetical protein [Oscillospiraceae bacterium]
MKKFTLLLCILLTIALLFSCTVHIFFYLQSQRVEEETRQTFREYNRQKDAYQQSIYDLEQTIQQLKSEMADMEKLIDLFDKKDELYAEMNNRLRDHQQKLAEAEIEIARLNADLEKLTVVCNIDMNAQRLLLDELENLLKNPPQKSTQVPIEPESETVTSSGGTAESTAETEPVYQTVLSDASISLYYRDLENGFTYSYNADAVYDSASLIKLPLALSLLQPTDGTDYDFSEIFTFDPEEIDETITEGSGEIKKIKEKTDFTYLQLFEYMIRYSDNVAFSAIKDKYSYTPLRNWCSVKGIGSMLRHGLSNLSAEDGGRIMSECHTFLNENEAFGASLSEWMENSSHAVMIDYGAHPKRVAHKYGWDENAYHDMAIVYDEHPYVLVILSDLHQGGKEVNAYIQSLVKLVDDFHENFYKVK